VQVAQCPINLNRIVAQSSHIAPTSAPSMAATKISRFFIIFTALLIDKIASYKAKETRTTTGRLTRPELTSDLNYFLSKGPMKSGADGDRPSKLEKAYVKRNSNSTTAKSQETKIYTIQDIFSTTITPASMRHLPTRSKRQRKQAGGLRTLRFTLTKRHKIFRYQLKSESKK
jgi:hypothetical protein